MVNSASPSVSNATLRDFRESWKLLKSNYRAFLGIEFFGMGVFLLIIIGVFSIQFLWDPNFATIFSRDLIQSINYRVAVLSIGFILLTIFINCQTGLAFDVMSSGEMFTEFGNAFSYFRQHWWKYILITFLMGGLGLSINVGALPLMLQHPGVLLLFSNPFGFIIIFVALGISFLWDCLFVESLASINAQGSFIRSISRKFPYFSGKSKTSPIHMGFVLPTFRVSKFYI